MRRRRRVARPGRGPARGRWPVRARSPNPRPPACSDPTPAEALEATRRIAPETLSESRVSDPDAGLADGRGHRRRRGGRHARRRPAGRPGRRIRPGPGHRRAVHAARSPRRGRHGHRLPGRAVPAGPAAGGAEADQGRHGLADRPGPVRRRTPGPGDDGPPQHRPGLRRRGHRRRPAVLRHGVRPGRPDHRLLRPAPAAGRRPARAVRRGLPGGAARPPEGDHPPRPQALQRDGHRGRRPAHAQGDRLRRGQGDRVRA